jgi:hypothetical protein
MSFNALNWAWDQPCPNSRAKLLLTFFANAASQAGGDCWPSIATICRRTQMAEMTVRKALKDLVRAGLVQIEERTAWNGAQQSNRYRLPVTSIPINEPDLSTPTGQSIELPDPTYEIESVEPAPLPQTQQPPPSEAAHNLPPSDLVSKPSLEPEERTKKESCSLRSQRARARAAPNDISEWEADFQAWYREYPRKKSPDTARKAYFARLRQGVTAAELLTGLRAHVFDDRPEYRPYPATWLNAGRWRDEPDDLFDPVLRAAGITPEMLADYEREAGQHPPMLT